MELEHKILFNDVRGIVVDSNGYVYVSDFNTNRVIVVSQEENKHRVLLSEKDGGFLPQSLFFDRTNNKLLIANLRQHLFIF